MKLNYSQKIFLVSLIIFVMVFILNIIFSSLLWNKVLDINDKTKQINISTQEREREVNLKDLLIKTATDREKMNQYFVGEGNIETVKFTEYLEGLAKKAGVAQEKSLAYEEVGKMNESEFVSAIRYKFKVSGNWASVYNFMRSMESLPKVGYLNNLKLSADIKESKIWSLDIDFSVIKLGNEL
jgi:Tfp pilus assembly protein PilO